MTYDINQAIADLETERNELEIERDTINDIPQPLTTAQWDRLSDIEDWITQIDDELDALRRPWRPGIDAMHALRRGA